MKIAVLAGGYSHERDVSLTSGCKIANTLCSLGHSVALADVYSDIDATKIQDMFSSCGNYSYAIPSTEPDLAALKAERGMGERLIGRGIIELCAAADIVFLALHGGMGEDGRIQAVLECAGIKYTGSDYGPCYLAMNKSISKTLFSAAGIPVPQGFIYRGENAEKIALPCVVKPCSLGSSVGVSIVHTKAELEAALGKVSSYEGDTLIESFVSGREFSCGVLDGKALPSIEIKPKSGFYDYEGKYQAGMTEEICPADITSEQEARIAALSEAAYRALGLSVYARFDFILDEKSGDFICLEANTLPGMTPASLIPQEAAAAGISYPELVTKIVAFSGENMRAPQLVTATDPITSLYGAFGKFTAENRLGLGDIEKVILTGVGSSHLKEPIYALPCEKVSEFECVARGGLYLSHLDEAVVVSMGTGTAIVHAKKNGNDYITNYLGGTGIGGGTLVGLSKIMLGMESIEHITELAADGSLDNVDLRIKDISSKESMINLPPDMTAANFGKVSDVASNADIALAIINMVFETAGMLAIFAARSLKTKDIVLTGNLAAMPMANELFTSLSPKFGVNFIIPEKAQFATAIGAAKAK